MKRKVGLLFVCILFYVVSFSQYKNYKTDSGWNLGFNTGGTWQQKEAIINGSDTTYTQPFTSIRGGFTFGKAIYEKEGSLLSFDLRFRYLRGINYGWANQQETISASSFFHQINDINAYTNYRMDLNEFSLEGVLTLNRLLEQTGIILYGFGGIGLVDYRVKADYLDGYFQYDYPDLTNLSSINAARQLKDNSDLQFESNAPGVLGNQLKFMPSLGIGLGYQFNESFSMGLEHKITYAFHNNLDGIFTDGLNDRYHYTAIKIGFNISNGGGSYDESNEMFQEDYYQPTTVKTPPPIINNTAPTPPPTSEQPNTEYVPNRPPKVKIVYPNANYTDVNNSSFTFNAELSEVDGKQNIIFLLNGVKQPNYIYDYTFNKITADINLKTGLNQIKIIGKNSFGSASDEVTINYFIPFEKTPPSVKITSPLANPYKSETERCLVIAKLKNISSPSQIKFYINNKVNNSFTLSSNGVFKSNITLNNGTNNVVITATNIDGTATDKATLLYEKRNIGTPPNVVINYPNTNPFNSNKQKVNVKAFAYHVDSKQNITVKLNNNKTSNYTFNTVTRQLTLNAVLNIGYNNIEIFAQNEFGSDSESIVVNYQKQVLVSPPNVVVDFPVTSTYTTDKEMILVEGKIYNVSNVNDATSEHNNKPTKYFQFNTSSKRFQSTLTLIPGANTFVVNATNDAGSDSELITIIYNPTECDNPSITRSLPQNTNISTTNNKAYIEMVVSNTQNIDFKVNGNSSSGYNFDVNTGVFSSMINLKPGTTVYTLSATNDCGTTSESVTYQLNQNTNQGQAPTIQINGLNNSSSHNNPIIVNSTSTQLTGNIPNHDSQTKMSYYSSPSKMAKLDYIVTSGNIVGTIFLSQNQTTKLTIVAENKWGKTTKDIYFKQPSKDPNTSSPSRSSNEPNSPIKNKKPEKTSQEEKESADQQAREKAAQQAREKAAQQAREKAAQQAREKAAQQAREKAAKEAAAKKAAEEESEKESEKKQATKKGGGR